MTAREELNELQREKMTLQSRLREVVKKTKEVERAVAKEEFGVEPGVLVVGTGYREAGVEFRVTQVGDLCSSGPWVTGMANGGVGSIGFTIAGDSRHRKERIPTYDSNKNNSGGEKHHASPST